MKFWLLAQLETALRCLRTMPKLIFTKPTRTPIPKDNRVLSYFIDLQMRDREVSLNWKRETTWNTSLAQSVPTAFTNEKQELEPLLLGSGERINGKLRNRLAENSHYKQKPSLKDTCSKPRTHAQNFLLPRHYSYTSVTLETTSPKVPCVQDATHDLFAMLGCTLTVLSWKAPPRKG